MLNNWPCRVLLMFVSFFITAPSRMTRCYALPVNTLPSMASWESREHEASDNNRRSMQSSKCLNNTYYHAVSGGSDCHCHHGGCRCDPGCFKPCPPYSESPPGSWGPEQCKCVLGTFDVQTIAETKDKGPDCKTCKTYMKTKFLCPRNQYLSQKPKRREGGGAHTV